MRRIGLNSCPYCGKDEIYASRPKTWRDEVCCFFFLQVPFLHAAPLSSTFLAACSGCIIKETHPDDAQ